MPLFMNSWLIWRWTLAPGPKRHQSSFSRPNWEHTEYWHGGWRSRLSHTTTEIFFRCTKFCQRKKIMEGNILWFSFIARVYVNEWRTVHLWMCHAYFYKFRTWSRKEDNFYFCLMHFLNKGLKLEKIGLFTFNCKCFLYYFNVCL